MALILIIGWIIAGTILYSVISKTLGVVHFSFQSMFSWWFGCMVAIGVIFAFVGSLIMSVISMIVGFFTAYYKWIIGAVVILVILGIWGSKSNSKIEKINETNNANS